MWDELDGFNDERLRLSWKVGTSVGPCDAAFIARAMMLPSESEISELVSPADPDVIHAARKFVVKVGPGHAVRVGPNPGARRLLSPLETIAFIMMRRCHR